MMKYGEKKKKRQLKKKRIKRRKKCEINVSEELWIQHVGAL